MCFDLFRDISIRKVCESDIIDFHTSFSWRAFVITIDYNSNLLLSLYVCVIGWRGYIRLYFFVYVFSCFCVFLPYCGPVRFQKNYQIYCSAYRDSTGGWTKLSIFWWRRETLIRWGITCHGDDSAGDGAGDGCWGSNGDGDMIQMVVVVMMVMVKVTLRWPWW